MKFTLSDQAAVDSAINALRAGVLIAYPTEAVFGIGCDPSNEAAVSAVIRLKQRDSTKGLIIIGATLEHIKPYADWDRLGKGVQTAILASWPGPQTWILPCSPRARTLLRGSHSGIAVRVTAHKPAAELCIAFGGALVSTSANTSGAPPAKTVEAVEKYFGDEISLILDEPVGGRKQPTPICDALTGRVLRS
ncbi:Sua5/YciO/YrdC/YwlC family protein [Paraburkholderia phenoliruptrix]|uniref:Sua5/YciO/YrdC/YwlC family protein n=1 Tax=Paraburkholderia phenoliruptrix TaxID=252970 RepID=UPI002869EB68|nr:Sua5/YciO/YrdC/YwlC family protein [Paraburkholderia phenoliruptrix]WMY09575.1 Sua5/YciO/YrdC/YwlC family protein [Paraburkholderia phenoliruptrix]